MRREDNFSYFHFLNFILILKGLLLLSYLVRNGSERVVDAAIEYASDIRRLEKFEYIDPQGKNQGINGTAYACMSLHQQ
jgi:hypothetical protein